MVLELIRQYFTGIPYGDVLFAVFLIGFSYLIAKMFYYIFRRYVAHIAQRTKNTLDDMIVSSLHAPIFLTVIFLGAFFALMSVDALTGYRSLLTNYWDEALILIVFFFFYRIVNTSLKWYQKEVVEKTESKTDDTFFPIVKRIINAFIIVIGLALILARAGVEITPLVASLGVGGLAVALALNDTLSNLFSGAYLVTDKAVNIGDFVEIDQQTRGTVAKIGWRSTHLQTWDGNTIIVPNSKMSQSILTNYSYPDLSLAVRLPLGVAYGSDLEQVEKVTLEVAKEVVAKIEGARKDFEPLILFSDFGDSNINFAVIVKVENYVHRVKLLHELVKAIKKRYDKEGIDISWPVRKIYYAK
ncbi:MAG: mechanosensitive ion channel family protein [Candidatus Aenigmarchaeota archaeon]|nr:mechanosensitive ion channel family protein [Candidatus Aenigmarchaeota archaeon]